MLAYQNSFVDLLAYVLLPHLYCLREMKSMDVTCMFL